MEIQLTSEKQIDKETVRSQFRLRRMGIPGGIVEWSGEVFHLNPPLNLRGGKGEL